MFSVLLLALLPLAATAQCSRSALDKCEKCGVGAIAARFSHNNRDSKPCNCNDNPGYFGEMCGKTGKPTYPVCCSTDGKKATEAMCACGTRSCGKDQYCTAKSATDADAKCVYKTCASTDGSKAYTGTNQCQCGTTSCRTDQKCTAKSATDAEAKCERPKNPCKTTDGGDAGNTYGCECGTTMCQANDGKCTAATNTCVVPEQPTFDACKDGAEVTKRCKCGRDLAAIGQTCKDSKATWPACGSSAIAKYGLSCMCGTGDTANQCTYGQKCLTSGANKDMCDCQPSDTVVCNEKVPPSDKCPLDCAGHTTVGAGGFQVNSCLGSGTGMSTKISIKDGNIVANYFYGEDCETASTMPSRVVPGGCNGDSYIDLPTIANSGTALKTMPIVLTVSILASMFL